MKRLINRGLSLFLAALVAFAPISHADQQAINRGTTAGDGQGEALFSAFGKVNANDAELYAADTAEAAARAAAIASEAATRSAADTAHDASIAGKLGDAPNDGKSYFRKNASWSAAGLLVMAESFGASPSATVAVNTAAIQAALDVGGSVSLNTPGTYLINKTLLIGSHTSFLTGAGVWLKLVDEANSALIRNLDAQNAVRATDFAVSAGTATVTEYGHTRTVGSQVYIEGALGNIGLNGAKTITAATATTWAFADAGGNPTNTNEVRIMVSRYNPVAGSNFTRSSNVVTVQETGHSRSVGDHVYITGLGGANSFNGMAKVTSVVHGVSWTYENTGANETATGTANVLGNTRIGLHRFKYDGNRLNQTGLDEWLDFPAVFVNIGNSYFDAELIRNYWWRGLNFLNAGNITVPSATFENGSVGIQFDSHCDAINLGVMVGRGMTDDVVAWGVTGQAGLFGETANPSGQGSMGTLKVGRIDGDSPTGLLKLYAYTGYDLGSVEVGTITGKGRAIAGDSNAGVSGGTITRLHVGKIDAQPIAAGQVGIAFNGLASYGDVYIGNLIDNYTSLATTFLVNVAVPVNKLHFDKLFSETYTTSYALVHVNTGATIRDLTISNSRLTAGNGGSAINIATGGLVTLLKLNNVEYSGAGVAGSANYYGNLLNAAAGSTLKRLVVDGLDLTVGQGNSAFNLAGGSQTVEIDVHTLNSLGNDGKMSSIFNDGSGSTSVNVRFSGMRFGVGPANNIFQLSGSGTWNIHGAGLHMPVANKFALLTAGTVSVSIDCPEARIDLGANAGAPPARLVPVAGDRIYNTNATGGGLYGRTAAGAWQLIF